MKSVVVPILLALTIGLGCIAETPRGGAHSDEGRYQELNPGEQYGRWEGEPFQQVGMLLDTSAKTVEARVDGGDWQPVEITWEEGEHKVGRVLLEAPATELELRADQAWTFGTVQFLDEIEATEVLARDLPFATPDVQISALAPASLVVSRAQWGARDPNRVCGSWHDPHRITIHHTDVPADDGGDPAARMRQIQAFHIDTRGWCDIGYHFVVSQSGRIYQGRSNEQRTGAHADDQNTGNIGICFIGDFDTQTMNATQFAAGAKILGWTATTYGVPFNRSSIRGHREVRGQATDCPGANLQSRIGEMISLAQEGGDVDPAAPSPVSFEVNWRSDESDVYAVGSSAGTPDVFPGDWMRAEIKFKNTTWLPLRGVEIGFEMEHLEATSYVIESDAPRFNGRSFSRNDASDNPNNLPSSRLGNRGTLGIYALAPGETKRVTIDFKAGAYSLGAVEHASLRAWVRHINHHYEDQLHYDSEPAISIFEGLLQDLVEVDVLSGNEWQFDGGESSHVEGWRGCAGARLTVDPTTGALTTRTGPGQCAQSPRWTSIDADRWDEMVVRMDVEGDHTAAVYWAHAGERFAANRAVTFEVSGTQDTYVLDLGSHAAWRGEVVRFQIVPSLEQGTTAAIDAVFMQSSAGAVSSTRERRVSGGRVRLFDDAPAPLAPGLDDRADASWDVERRHEASSGPVGGCSTTSRDPSASALLLALVVGTRRRRRRV